MKRLLFYDLETSGLDCCYDQILQFAAVMTDLQLQPLERFEWWVRLNPDLWPSPMALAVTGISLAFLRQHGNAEVTVVRRIHQLFNQPDTISIGFNNLGFDDEFLRFSFHRNLLEPYHHQYAQGCYRMDIYPMLVWRWLHYPQEINWPTAPQEPASTVPSMKLERIRAANQLQVPGNAHNAMSDVLTTIEVAKLLQAQPEMWRYSMAYFNKEVDRQRIAKATRTISVGQTQLQVAIWVSGEFGRSRAFTTVAAYLGPHRHYHNQQLWVQLDRSALAIARAPDNVNTTLAQQFPVILRKKLGEPPFVLPYDSSRLCLSDERQVLIEHNLALLARQLAVWQEYWLEYKYPIIPNLDADASLYQQGFLSNKLRTLLQQLHHHQEEPAFWLARLADLPAPQAEQTLRILGRQHSGCIAPASTNWPLTLKQRWQAYLQQALWGNQLLNFKGQPRRNATAFWREWVQCKNLNTIQQQELVRLYQQRQLQRQNSYELL